MREPVVAADGYSYERQAIQAWLTTRDSSPMTNEQLDDKVRHPPAALQCLPMLPCAPLMLTYAALGFPGRAGPG